MVMRAISAPRASVHAAFDVCGPPTVGSPHAGQHGVGSASRRPLRVTRRRSDFIRSDGVWAKESSVSVSLRGSTRADLDHRSCQRQLAHLAEKINVGPRDVWTGPDFLRAGVRIRGDQVQRSLVPKEWENRAIETLAALMAADVAAAVRLGAARTVAELGIHQHDAETIMRKLDEIEAYQRQDAGRR
jgi:hypothetical protein